MSSLKELYHEILKTQQDIAVTYGRVVGVENELKKKLSEEIKYESIDERLDNLQSQLNNIVKLLTESNGVSAAKVKEADNKEAKMDALDDVKDKTPTESHDVVKTEAADDVKPDASEVVESAVDTKVDVVKSEPKTEATDAVKSGTKVDEPKTEVTDAVNTELDEPKTAAADAVKSEPDTKLDKPKAEVTDAVKSEVRALDGDDAEDEGYGEGVDIKSPTLSD